MEEYEIDELLIEAYSRGFKDGFSKGFKTGCEQEEYSIQIKKSLKCIKECLDILLSSSKNPTKTTRSTKL